jgi:hypothetical protein
MSPSSRNWPLKSNRDTGRNTKAPTLNRRLGGVRLHLFRPVGSASAPLTSVVSHWLLFRDRVTEGTVPG